MFNFFSHQVKSQLKSLIQIINKQISFISYKKSKPPIQITKSNKKKFLRLKILNFFFLFFFFYHYPLIKLFSPCFFISLIVLLQLKLFFFLHLLYFYFYFAFAFFLPIYCHLLEVITIYLKVFQAIHIKQYHFNKISNR